ncbi:MAG: M20/M25/M40 family metallo-hydrolase [Blastocatellia bacterium]
MAPFDRLTNLLPGRRGAPLGPVGESLLGGLLADQAVTRALAWIERSGDQFTEEQVRICEIPSPPFGEEARGDYLAGRFRELGLSGVHRDEVGNVIGLFPGTEGPGTEGSGEASWLVVSAHLDTVFPAGTDVTVRRIGKRLHAPGIGDDVAGLALLPALIEALREGAILPAAPLAFVATVGEEGEGDLRGVRHLFAQGRLAGRIGRFISFDGAGVEWLTHQALGSRRYRIRVDGPGGHSWGDFGVVQPVHALAKIIARLADYPAPSSPRTTFNVGRIEGGESVNVIPTSAWMDVDLRSAGEAELSQIEEFLLAETQRTVQEENRLRRARSHPLTLTTELIGSRPSGEIPLVDPLVQTAIGVTRALGIEPILSRASTDANVPIHLGIPAITLGAGGVSGDPHRLTEWYDPTGRELGYRRALLLILALTGIASRPA